MAGGTFTTQNKVRPGVYINFLSEARPLGVLGERGIVTMALSLPWGPSKQMLTINAGDDTWDILGYDITYPGLLPIKEVLKRAKTLILYRLNTGVKATATIGTLTATAKYGGLRGNNITIVVQANIDDPNKFDVKTRVEGIEVEKQIVAIIEELKSNSWVDFSGNGAPGISAGTALTGGANGEVTNQDHTDYLAQVELYGFNTIALVSDDSNLKSVYATFVQRLREESGKKVQGVLANYPDADYEGIIKVKNGVILSDGTTINATKAVAWVAGVTAGAGMNQSLTYTAYDGAVDVDTRYSSTQIEQAILNGEFVFIPGDGAAIVEQDINSLHAFTTEKDKYFAKNRVIRVLDGIANDLKRTFDQYYIGKIDNSDDGRNLFKNEVVNYFNTLQNMGAVQGFDPQNDIQVLPGVDKDSIYIELNITPVDSAEKIYMKITVR